MTRRTLLAMLAMEPLAGWGQSATVANIAFYSDELMNLHHTLYGAAWARRPEAGTLRALAGPLPAALDAAMKPEERAAWDRAVDYYDKNVAARDLLFARGMVALNDALWQGHLDSDAVGSELRATLESATPVYRRYFWPDHDRINRAWITVTTGKMKTVATEVIGRLEKLYGSKWFTSPVRADVVWVGNRQGAYTSEGPAHSTISSGAAANRDWTAVEIVFHEYSHLLVEPVQKALEKALGERLRQHRDLWHVVQFYLTGKVMQEVLEARGVEYSPYLYSTGLFDRAWPQYRKVMETNWPPYMAHQISLDEAISRTVQTL